MWIGAALLSFACVSLAPRPARAHGGNDAEALLTVVSVGITCAVVDTAFLMHDVVVAAERGHPSVGWSVTEVVLTAPQVALVGALVASDSEGMIWPIFPGMFAGAMLTHGIWSLAEDPEAPKPGTRFLASSAVGVNGMLSLTALTALGNRGHVFSRPMGITEVVLTLPQVAVGAAGLGLDAENRPIWGAFTAWSGVLLAHGVTSIALGEGDEAPSSSGLPSRRRVGAVEPRVLGFGPVPFMGSDGRTPGMGFVLRGSL